MQKHKGFTLAEVLITLSIIGVVAALTIPALTRDYEEMQCRTAFKKVYSDFNQTTKMLMVENGGSVEGVLKIGILPNEYCKYFKCAKDCDWGDYRGTCWHASGVEKQLNGVTGTPSLGGGFVLTNGTLVAFNGNADGTCDETRGSISGICARIAVDVNGFKGPNQWGRDLFSFWVRAESLVPGGIQGGTGTDNDCTTSGFGCAANVLQNIDY